MGRCWMEWAGGSRGIKRVRGGSGRGLLFDIYDVFDKAYLDHTIPGRSACIASTSIGVFLDVLSCFSLLIFFLALCPTFFVTFTYYSYRSYHTHHTPHSHLLTSKLLEKHIQNALFVPPSPPQSPSPPQRPLRPPPIPRTHQHLCQTTHQRPPLPTQCPKPTHPRWTTTRQPPRPDRPPKRTSFPPHRRRCQTLCRPNTGGLSD